MNLKIKTMLLMLVFSQLSGCTQFRKWQSKDFLSQGKMKEGVQVLDKAVKRDPQNTELRAALLNTKTESTARLFALASEQRLQGNYDAARATTQRIFEIEPNNDRAKTLLDDMDRDIRHQEWLDAALEMIKTDRRDRAKDFIEKILRENAKHPEAKQLRYKLEVEQRRMVDDQTLQLSEVRPVSLEFRDANLKMIFEILAKHSGINFILDKDLRSDAQATIFLRDARIEDAIDLLASTNQLSKKILNSKTVLIYPNTPEKQKEYQELLVKSFFLANADAKALSAQVRTMFKLREVIIDEKLNAIVVRDTPEAIRLAEKVIGILDIGEPEVMLEVEVLEVNHSRLAELGMNFPNQIAFSPIPPNGANGLTLSTVKHLHAENLGVSFSNPTLNLRRELGDANVLANPRIRAKNKEKAKILIGDRLPVVSTTTTATGFVSENIQYAEVGIKLEVEPLVSLDDEVSIKVALEVSSVGNQVKTPTGSIAYQIGTRTANTVLKLRDGETQVLAGLINNTERSSANRIPGFGDVPVLGRLFGSTLDSTQKTEVVLSITPRLVRNIRRPDITDSEFWSGTDSKLSTKQLVLPIRARAEKLAPKDQAASSKGGAAVKPAAELAPSVQPAATTPSTASPAAAAQPAAVPMANGSGDDRTGGVTSRTPTRIELKWPASVAAKLDEIQTIQLKLASDGALLATPLQIGFDPAYVQILDAKEGGFFAQDGGASSFSQQVVDGKLLISAARNGTQGVFGDDVLATIRYRALKQGESVIRIVSASALAGDSSAPAILIPAPLKVTIK